MKKANALVLHHKKQFDTYAKENKQALNEMHASHKSSIGTLEADHKKEMDSLIESHKLQIEEFQTKFASQQHRIENNKDEAKVLELQNTITAKENELEEARSEILALQQTIYQQKDVMASSGTAPSQKDRQCASARNRFAEEGNGSLIKQVWGTRKSIATGEGSRGRIEICC